MIKGEILRVLLLKNFVICIMFLKVELFYIIWKEMDKLKDIIELCIIC